MWCLLHACLSQREVSPHLGLFSSFSLKVFFKFFLIRFEGLRTEDATTVQLVKPFKANMFFFGFI